MLSAGSQDAAPGNGDRFGASALVVGRGAAAVLAAALVALIAGCTSPPKPPPPPPAVLNFAARQDGVEIVVGSLITWEGPQAWLADPTWDEYVVTVSNRTGSPLELESVRVVDLLDRVSEGSPDPATLATRSVQNWKAYVKAKLPVYPQYLPVSGSTAVMSAAALSVLMPIYAIYVPIAIAENAIRQPTIQQEFKERLLDFSQPLAPGESALGSVFVPLAAGPKRLEFRVKGGADPVLLVVPLPGLSQLHLSPRP